MCRELPDFVVWADEPIIKTAMGNILTEYGIDGLTSQKIVCKDMPLANLRELATVVSEIGYNKDLYEQIDSESQRWLKNELNAEFDRRISGILGIYNMLDKKHNTEKWGGEERYKLLALHNRKGYSEMSVLKNSVWLSQLIGKTVTVTLVEEINKAVTSTVYWEFGYENRDLQFDESEENFKICNAARLREINAQNEFVNLVCTGKLDDAYRMIKEQIQKYC